MQCRTKAQVKFKYYSNKNDIIFIGNLFRKSGTLRGFHEPSLPVRQPHLNDALLRLNVIASALRLLFVLVLLLFLFVLPLLFSDGTCLLDGFEGRNPEIVQSISTKILSYHLTPYRRRPALRIHRNRRLNGGGTIPDRDGAVVGVRITGVQRVPLAGHQTDPVRLLAIRGLEMSRALQRYEIVPRVRPDPPQQIPRGSVVLDFGEESERTVGGFVGRVSGLAVVRIGKLAHVGTNPPVRGGDFGVHSAFSGFGAFHRSPRHDAYERVRLLRRDERSARVAETAIFAGGCYSEG